METLSNLSAAVTVKCSTVKTDLQSPLVSFSVAQRNFKCPFIQSEPQPELASELKKQVSAGIQC